MTIEKTKSEYEQALRDRLDALYEQAWQQNDLVKRNAIELEFSRVRAQLSKSQKDGDTR